jgi:RNA polymerase primary sigma factor
LRLVYAGARKQSGSQQQFYDNFQNGTLGLLHAISYFDYRRGWGFGPYAKWWIKQSMLLRMKEESNMINLPNSTWQAFNYVERIKAKLKTGTGKPENLQELAKESGYSQEQLRRIAENVANAQTRSLDYVIDDDNNTTVMQLVQAPPEAEAPPELTAHLQYLTQVQRRYLCLHYGLLEHLPTIEIEPQQLLYEQLKQAALSSKG